MRKGPERENFHSHFECHSVCERSPRHPPKTDELAMFVLVPREAEQVLDQFQGVFLEELPHEIPLLRDIKLAIDLVPGATLTNLPHYRMNPTEHVELKRQVRLMPSLKRASSKRA